MYADRRGTDKIHPGENLPDNPPEKSPGTKTNPFVKTDVRENPREQS